MFLRPSTSDSKVFIETFVLKTHLPPKDTLSPNVRIVVDLGGSIGLTAADMANRFPEARIVMVEMDQVSAELARHNLQPWADRCTVIEAAAWSTDGHVSYELIQGEEWAARVTPSGRKRVASLRLDTLLEGIDHVDYMKIDIEGAERILLSQNTEWTHKVHCLRVETHPPFKVSECATLLRELGFAASVDHMHRVFVNAKRNDDKGRA